MPLRVAIIGGGKWSEFHMAGWRAQRDAEVTWVVRSDPRRAQEKAHSWGIGNWSADYRAVLERDDVDIADILLPHDMHAEATCFAVAHGKHVLLEKPIAPSMPEARQIAEAARAHKRKVMIAENWIYSTWVKKTRELIQGGEIGKPFLIRSAQDLEVRQGFAGLGWRYSLARMGGGALMDSGTHSISVCRYLMGEVDEVAGLGTCHAFSEISPMEDTFLMFMQFVSGASGSVSVTWVAQRERPHTEFMVLGTKGTIEFDTHSRHFFVTRSGRRCEEFDASASRGFTEEVAHFLSCITEDRNPITCPEEQIGSLSAVLAAYRAAELGRKVSIREIAGQSGSTAERIY
jgi:UDP-N-acetylglucosamine 3-dehydrogenase